MAVPGPFLPFANNTVNNISKCLDLPPLDTFLCIQRIAEGSGYLQNYSVCESGLFPLPLTNTADCAPGFYCPNSDVNDSSTWPQVCPATLECQFARLGNQWCEPQGKYEPQLCEPGYHCPDQFTKIQCPENTWCIRGTVDPRPCPQFSLCPPGTQIGRYYGGTMCVAAIDLAILLYFVWKRYIGDARASRRNAVARREGLLDAYYAEANAIKNNPLRVLHGLASTGRRPSFRLGSVAESTGMACAVPRDQLTEARLRQSSSDRTRAKRDGFNKSAGSSMRIAFTSLREDLRLSADDLRAALYGYFLRCCTRLPAGLDTTYVAGPQGHKLRVRTKSMRRSSGSGALFAGLDEEDTARPSGLLGSRAGPVVSYANGSSNALSLLRPRSTRMMSTSTPVHAVMSERPNGTGIGDQDHSVSFVKWSAEPVPVVGSTEASFPVSMHSGVPVPACSVHEANAQGQEAGTVEMSVDASKTRHSQPLESAMASRAFRLQALLSPPDKSITPAIKLSDSASRPGVTLEYEAREIEEGNTAEGTLQENTPGQIDDRMSQDRLVGIAATALLAEGFSRCNAGLRLELSFTGLGLTLPPPINKTILTSVSGRIVPGRVTAILGPSGAGKTTFLSVLMGKVQRTAGILCINGEVQELSSYRRITGFVPQEDVMMRELTVRENIAHAARVRLPRRGWSAEAINRHVDAVIQVLGLSACADTLSSRVSGGQRKRTNIGMELAVAPSAIFLDEPTSGLDSTAALEVCSTLRAIADLGLTVVAVIHQPRAEIFYTFDDLLLLAPGGHTVYMGPQSEVAQYFEDAGCPIVDSPFGGMRKDSSNTDLAMSASKSSKVSCSGNPADDLLDAIAGRGARLLSVSRLLEVGLDPDSATGLASVIKPRTRSQSSVSISDASLGTPQRRPPASRMVSLRGSDMALYLVARWRVHSIDSQSSAGGASREIRPIAAMNAYTFAPVAVISSALLHLKMQCGLDGVNKFPQTHGGLVDGQAPGQVAASASASNEVHPAVPSLEWKGHLSEDRNFIPLRRIFSWFSALPRQVRSNWGPKTVAVPAAGAQLSTAGAYASVGLSPVGASSIVTEVGTMGPRCSPDHAGTMPNLVATGSGVAQPIMQAQPLSFSEEGRHSVDAVGADKADALVQGAAWTGSEPQPAMPITPDLEWKGHLPKDRNVVPVRQICKYCARLHSRASTAMTNSRRWLSLRLTHLRGRYKHGAATQAALEAGTPLTPMQAADLLMEDRGATMWQQFLLCHARCMLQQYRQISWLALELLVCVMAGGIMGLAATAVSELYSGILAPPYTLLSPAPMETMLPSLGLFINMAIGIAGSPAAVKTFCEERQVYIREQEGGHSLFAYFMAKNVTSFYRLTIAALHFSAFFVLLAKPTASFDIFFVITLGIFFGVYGLSMLVSMAVARENSSLMGVIAALVLSCLCGYGPNLNQGHEWGIFFIQDMAYSRWANELWMHTETVYYRDLFLVEQVSSRIFGYTLNRPIMDVGMMVAIGLGLRTLAYVALVLKIHFKLGAAQ